jgi:hypothetical protein
MTTNIKDITTIIIQFKASTGKHPLKMNLVDTITRGEALCLIDVIAKGKRLDVFSVKGVTINGSYIVAHP